MRLKEGVKLHGMQPQVVLALMIIEDVYLTEGMELVVTSVSDGKHMRASKHYTGCAADLRSMGLTDPDNTVLKIKAALGRDFDVIYEGRATQGAHIHVEWDPKEDPVVV